MLTTKTGRAVCPDASLSSDAPTHPKTTRDLSAGDTLIKLRASAALKRHVNRSLQELRANNLIDLRQRRLVINDVDRLASQSLFTSNYLHLDQVGADRPHTPA